MTTRRKTIYWAIAGLLLALGAVSQIQNFLLEAELQAVADAKVSGFEADYRTGGQPAIRTATAVVAARKWLVAGPITGKVSVYVEHLEAEGDAVIEGFEFLYERQGSDWRQVESGRCTSEECRGEGRKLLKSLDSH